ILGQLAKLIDKMDNRLPLSIIMVDLDNLNQINDTYGHLAGDHVIKGAISRLATVLQGYPFGRYGGDEFMILLPKFNGEDALKFAEKIKVVMAEKPFELGKRSISLTISQGVTEISYNEKVVKAIQRVDSALIEAKKKGGGVIVYRPLSED
ncbi:MAG: GGDEF domain-containing protein, partial [Gammaproteobacteria bacterium]|nr:GGDEF domain-containing protein [Gammaproteobacteria bacterium]